MAITDGRQRGTLWLGLGIALLAICGALGMYFWWLPAAPATDPKLLEELAGVELIDDPPPTSDAWPQWRGVNRDGQAMVTGERIVWPKEEVPISWRIALGGGQSSMAVAEGKLITMTQDEDQELVLCVDAVVGRVIWRYPYTAKFNNPQVQGPSSTPTIANGRVFTVGATGQFHALDLATGKKLWSHDLLKQFGATNLRWGTSFSPLVEGDLVITNPGGPKGQSVVAFNVATGDVVWKALDNPAGYSSPIAATIDGVRQIIVFTGDSLAGLQAADGKVLWSYPWNTQFQVNAATPIIVRAMIGGKETVYIFISSGYNKGCALVRVEQTEGAFEAKTVYTGNQLRAHFSSPVRVHDLVYGFDNQNSLISMDIKSGKVFWKEGGFGRGTMFLAGNELVVLSETGKLAIIEPSTEGLREKGSWNVLEGQCWSAPCLVGGRLYVRNQNELVCIQYAKP